MADGVYLQHTDLRETGMTDFLLHMATEAEVLDQTEKVVDDIHMEMEVGALDSIETAVRDILQQMVTVVVILE